MKIQRHKNFKLIFKIVIVSASFVICLISCSSNISKLEGKWEITEIMYDGENIENHNDKHIEVDFVGDSLQIFTFPYSQKTDTVRIRIKGNVLMSFNKEKKEYENVAIIESLSNEKIALKISNEYSDGHEITNMYERIAQPKDYSKEKEVPQKSYSKRIVGEWEFTERKSNRYYSDGEWKDYGEPVGWLMVFAKDGTGYQFRDNKVVTFNWLMPANGNMVIITGTKYDDTGFIISNMTKNTMLWLSEDEDYKLIRRQ